MTQPGAIPNLVPPGDDWLGRQLRDLTRQVGEMQSAMMRAGLIGNDALAAPVTGLSYNGHSDAQPFSRAGSYLHAGGIVTPDGFTTAIVLATVTVGATLTIQTDDYIVAAAAIGKPGEGGAGVVGEITSQVCPAMRSASVAQSYSRTLTGLAAGDQIVVAAYGSATYSDTGWTGANGHVAALALFFR